MIKTWRETERKQWKKIEIILSPLSYLKVLYNGSVTFSVSEDLRSALHVRREMSLSPPVCSTQLTGPRGHDWQAQRPII